jgi:FKBP-type peptidyl-prolyl cis-trans isomerase 2
VGDLKQVTFKPENGYGTIDPKAVQEVQKKLIPANALEVGACFERKVRMDANRFRGWSRSRTTG